MAPEVLSSSVEEVEDSSSDWDHLTSPRGSVASASSRDARSDHKGSYFERLLTQSGKGNPPSRARPQTARPSSPRSQFRAHPTRPTSAHPSTRPYTPQSPGSPVYPAKTDHSARQGLKASNIARPFANVGGARGEYVNPASPLSHQSRMRPASAPRAPPVPPRPASAPPPTTGAAKAKEEAGSPLRRPESAAAARSTYQFHLDVPAGTDEHGTQLRQFYVWNTAAEWDKGDSGLSTDVLSPNIKYQNVYYNWTMQRKDASPMTLVDAATWRQLTQEDRVAVEHVVEWCQGVRPRCIHDYKPLLVLMQSAVRTLANKELALWSEELEETKQRLAAALLEIERLRKELNMSAVGNIAGRMGRKASMSAQKRKSALELAESMSALSQEKDSERNKSLKLQAENLERMIAERDEIIEAMKRDRQRNQAESDQAKLLAADVKDKLAMLAMQLKKAKEEKQVVETQAKEQHVLICDERLRMEPLKMLFAEYGSWQFVSDMDELRMMSNLAQDHILEKYGAICELSRVSYNPDMDPDGDDDPDSYDDNLMEVMVTRKPGSQTGRTYFSGDAPLMFEAANARALVFFDPDAPPPTDPPAEAAAAGPAPPPPAEAHSPAAAAESGPKVATEEGSVGKAGAGSAAGAGGAEAGGEQGGGEGEEAAPRKERTLFAPIMVTKQHEGRERIEVWGIIEVQGGFDREECRLVAELVAEGMGRLMERLHLKELNQVQKVTDRVAKVSSAPTYLWQRCRDEFIGKKANFWSLGQELKERAKIMKQLRRQQDIQRGLEKQRAALDKMMAKETAKCALAQIKQYRQPTWTIVGVVMALYTTLGHHALWSLCHLNKTGIYTVPDDSRQVWGLMHKRMNTNMLLKNMASFKPKVNMINSQYTEWGEEQPDGSKVNVTQQRNQTVDELLQKISAEDAKYSSIAVGLCYEWVHTMRLVTKCLDKQQELEIMLGFDGDPDTED